MKNSAIRLYTFIFVMVWSTVMTAAVPGFCDTVKKVAVCPLEMNAPEDLSFLQKGLFSMLFSRLSDPGKVEVLDRETIDRALTQAQASPATQGPLNESKAKLIGASLGVDYILFGSMTQFGSSVSLDLSMVSVKGEKPALTFSKQAPEPGAVITELDMAATEINLKTFNREPELILPKEQYAQRPEPGPGGEGYASPLTNYRNVFAANGIINGIASADLDGKTGNEVVIIYDHAVEILKDNGAGQLIPVQRISDAHYLDIIAVDAADINGNGMAEIFVTRVDPQTGFVKSFVLEYDNGEYRRAAHDLPWYLRVIRDMDGKEALYGQKSGNKGPYGGRDVFKVVWENNAYGPGERVMVPEGFTILSAAVGSGMAGKGGNTLFTDEDGRLVLFSETGKIEWSGEEGYGGSKLFYTLVEKGIFEKNSTSKNPIADKGVFFQPRNLVADTDSDGKADVLVIRNVDAADNFFGRIRRFKSGSIELLKWNEMGLSPDRAPKKLPGQITDFVLSDFDNNGKGELLITLVKNRNNFSPEDSKSLIVAFDL